MSNPHRAGRCVACGGTGAGAGRATPKVTPAKARVTLGDTRHAVERTVYQGISGPYVQVSRRMVLVRQEGDEWLAEWNSDWPLPIDVQRAPRRPVFQTHEELSKLTDAELEAYQSEVDTAVEALHAQMRPLQERMHDLARLEAEVQSVWRGRAIQKYY